MTSQLLVLATCLIYNRTMKRFILVIAISFVTLSSYAQNRMDTLYFRSGKVEAVDVTVNYDDKIEFVYPGESMRNVASKDNLIKIIYKSGRLEYLLGKDNLNEDQRKLKLLEDKHTIGSIKPLDEVKHINLSIKISDSVKNRFENDVNQTENYIRSTFETYCSTMSLYSDKFTSKGFNAVLFIVSADDDGEIYGRLDYYRDGETEPFYSVYLNGNGSRAGKTFDQRLLGGVKNATIKAKKYIYDY